MIKVKTVMNKDILLSYWWRLQDDREGFMSGEEGSIEFWEKMAEKEKLWVNLNIIRCIIDELKANDGEG